GGEDERVPDSPRAALRDVLRRIRRRGDQASSRASATICAASAAAPTGRAASPTGARSWSGSAPAASSDAGRLRTLLVGGDDEIREAPEQLDGELRTVPDEPLEPLVLDNEQLDVVHGDGRRGAGPLAKQADLAEGQALAGPVQDLLDAVEAPADLDGAGVDDECLVASIVSSLEDDLARLELPPLDVAQRQVLVDLEADRRQRRLALDRQPRVGPPAEAALEDPHVLVAPLAEHGGDPLAGRLLGARAVGDDHLRGLDVERRLVRLLGREPDRARDPERARLEVGLGPHVEQSRIEPALDEPDHLRRHDPEAILPPALAPHPAVDADTHQ